MSTCIPGRTALDEAWIWIYYFGLFLEDVQGWKEEEKDSLGRFLISRILWFGIIKSWLF